MQECPNCGEELRFRVHIEHDGAGEWTTFRGYSAECVEKDCTCELTPEQWDALEREAIEGSDPDPLACEW